MANFFNRLAALFNPSDAPAPNTGRSSEPTLPAPEVANTTTDATAPTEYTLEEVGDSAPSSDDGGEVQVYFNTMTRTVPSFATYAGMTVSEALRQIFPESIQLASVSSVSFTTRGGNSLTLGVNDTIPNDLASQAAAVVAANKSGEGS